MRCNYSCEYCILDKTIQDTLDSQKLLDFQKILNNKFPDTTIFIFGGEPILHPKFIEIVNNFKWLNQPFIVQTNFSKRAVDILKDLSIDINISVHPTQISMKDLEVFKNLKDLKCRIKQIDIMFYGLESIQIYKIIQEILLKQNFNNYSLLPVANFYNIQMDDNLKKYNILKKTGIDIKFETLKKYNPCTGVLEDRSIIWEKMMNGSCSTYGKPCLYGDAYHLFSADLQYNNCCYREKTNGICNKTSCFLM